MEASEYLKQLPLPWQTYWQELGYDEPALIQTELSEPLSAGDSLFGISPTGSGKTVAYLVPLLQQLTPGAGNQLLILLPSQELAVQVTSVTKEWAERLGLSVQGLIGGANVRRQIEKLREKPEVLVGTPGRVHELIKQRKVKAHLIKTLVLDEFDQLVETSELNATQHILKSLDTQRQIVAVSATDLTAEQYGSVEWIATLPRLNVTEAVGKNTTVTHQWLAVEPRKRLETLRHLAHVPGFKAVVFFNELQELGAVAEKLSYQGVPNATLASDQNKIERRAALAGFEENKVNLLLTTDLAARGLDFTALPYVVHYDVPYNEESYTHRSGRTGRMGQSGAVLSFAGVYNLRDLRQVTRGVTTPLVQVKVHGGAILPVEAGETTASKPAPTSRPASPNQSQAEAPKPRTKLSAEPKAPVVKKKKQRTKQKKNKGARRQ